MKTRIMSKKQITETLLKMRSDEDNRPDARIMDKLMFDILIHQCADGTTVKIYNDVPMGGTVVEIVE